MALKFDTSVTKGLKLKVRKFWELNFLETTGAKLVGRAFLLTPILNRVNTKVGVINFMKEMTTIFQEVIRSDHSFRKLKVLRR